MGLGLRVGVRVGVRARVGLGLGLGLGSGLGFGFGSWRGLAVGGHEGDGAIHVELAELDALWDVRDRGKG